MEAHPQDLNAEVDGVAGQVPFRPAPITVFEEQAGMAGQLKVAGVAFAQGQPALLQLGDERHQTGGADLFAGPAGSGARC